MDDRIKQMINSDDPEIAILGAKLLVQEDETKKRIKIPKWFIEFYKDTKGNLHSRFIKKVRRNRISQPISSTIQEAQKVW